MTTRDPNEFSPEAFAKEAGTLDDAGLFRAAKSVFETVPPARMSTYAMHLLWCREQSCGNPFRALAELRASTATSACGYVFKLGDIAWNCRTCEKDQTCVLCDSCFRRSKHVGHEVYFHRASPGGCCDCGDLEAWLGEACCEVHQPKVYGEPDDEASLPAALLGSARVVVRAAALALCDTVSRCVAAHEPLEAATNWTVEEAPSIRIHNDDVHNVQQVAEVLRRAGAPHGSARRAVEYADANGEAVVSFGSSNHISPARRLDILHQGGLLASIVDRFQLEREKRAVAIANWLSALVIGSDGMRRLVAVEFARPVDKEGSDTFEFVDSTRYGMHEEVVDDERVLMLHWNEGGGRYPESSSASRGRSILSSTPFSVLIACDPLVTKNMCIATHDVLLRLLVDSVARDAVASTLLNAYRFISTLFARGVGTSDLTVFALSVQIFTTPSLVKKTLAPSPGAGVAHSGVLSVVVSALVSALEQANCDAVRERQREVEALPLTQEDSFLNSDIVRHRRYTHAVRDLEYILQTDDVACIMLLPPHSSDAVSVVNGQGRPLDAWLALLSRLQGIDAFVRRQGIHVEHESRRWVYAFNLVLNIFTTCDLVTQRVLDAPQRQVVSEDMPTTTPEIRTLAVRHAMRSTIAALLEWLAARQGTLAWHPIGGCQHLALKFDVFVQPVSLHLPLHRLITQLALRSLAAGLHPLPDLFDRIETSPRLTARLATALAHLLDPESPSEHMTLGATDLDDIMAGNNTFPEPAATPADLSIEQTREVLGVALCEHPLRALAYCAHVLVGLWRRNGQTAMQTVLNYASPPLSYGLRDLDMQTVLLGAKLLSPDRVVESVLNIFRVEEYLRTEDLPPRSDTISGSSRQWQDHRLLQVPDSALGACAHEALSLVIQLVTEIPPPADLKFVRQKIRCELAHLLAVSPRRHSEIVAVVTNASKAYIHGTSSSRELPLAPVTDQLLGEISIAKEDSTGPLWDLRPDVAREVYDPTFPRLSRASHEKALERVARFGKESAKRCKPRPLVPKLPAVHAEFETVRSGLLRCHSTLRLCLSAFRRGRSALENDGSLRELECRALHLATLVAHDAIANNRSLSDWLLTNDSVLASILRLRDAARKSTDYFGSSIYDEGVEWLAEAAARSDARCDAFVKGHSTPLVASKDDETSSSNETIPDSKMPATVDASAKKKEGNDDEAAKKGERGDDAAKRKRRDAARKRALKAMSKRQSAFVASLLTDGNDDSRRSSVGPTTSSDSDSPAKMQPAGTDNEDEKMDTAPGDVASAEGTRGARAERSPSAETQPRSPTVAAAKNQKDVAMRRPMPCQQRECIVCWSTSDTEVPYLVGLAQQSLVLSRRVEGMGADRRRFSRTYMVGDGGCVLRRYASDIVVGDGAFEAAIAGENVANSHVVATLEARQIVRVTAIRNEWARVLVVGNVATTSSQQSQRSSSSTTRGKRFANGGEGTTTTGWVKESELRRVSDFAWERWGRSRLHVSTCGHAVHPSCWDSFFGSLLAKADTGEIYEGRFCVDPDLGQFLCPLCKGFSNCLLPDVPARNEEEATERLSDGTLARWILSGGVDRGEIVDDASVSTTVVSPIDESEQSLSSGGREDESTWASQQHWKRRCSTSLCNVADGSSSRNPSRLAEVYAAWNATAYSATMATSGEPRPPPQSVDLYRILAPMKRGIAAASTLSRALRFFPESILGGGETESIRQRLSAALAGRRATASSPPVLDRSNKLSRSLGVVKPNSISTESWHANSERRVELALSTPLVAWDLSVFLCAAMSTWPVADLPKLVAAVAVARLAQILADPMSSFPDEGTADEDGDDEALLKDLRNLLRRAAGRGDDGVELPRRSLAVSVRDAWIPFLRTALFLAKRGANRVDEEDQLDDLAYETEEELRSELGVPSPREIAECGEMREVFRRWGQHLDEAEKLDERFHEDEKVFAEILQEARLDTDSDSPFFDVESTKESEDVDKFLTKSRLAADPASRDEDETAALMDSPPLKKQHVSHPFRSLAEHVDFSRMCLSVDGESSSRSLFVSLPENFTHLYTALVRNDVEESDDPALCLLTGRVLKAGRRAGPTSPGACTAHAKAHGNVGIFFLVLKCATLLVSGSYACYCDSLYVDEFGEEDVGLRRGSPLKLCQKRLRTLERLYTSHGVAAEVTRRRASSTRVIREDFY